MRLLVWTLGVICTMAALMSARAIAPGWQWVWWLWLVLWVLVGLVVVIAAAVRVLTRSAGPPGVVASVPQRSAPPGAQG